MLASSPIYSVEDAERVLTTMFFLPQELEMLKHSGEFFGALERAKTAEEMVDLIRKGEKILAVGKGTP